MIYWFSGTGNSLFAAKILSEDLGLPLHPIALGVPEADVPAADQLRGNMLGFVFPSYYGLLPRAVCHFVEQLDIPPDAYVFALVTMGSMGQGSVAALDRLLRSKGLRLAYGRGLSMPANYVMMYNPANPDKCGDKLKKAKAGLRRFSAEIAAGAQTGKAFGLSSRRLYNKIETLDDKFGAEDSCTGCGQCARLCPVRNISMEEGKPVWLHHCEHCASCISWCPAQAIQYGSRTKSRRRYCNPEIKPSELLRADTDKTLSE